VPYFNPHGEVLMCRDCKKQATPSRDTALPDGTPCGEHKKIALMDVPSLAIGASRGWIDRFDL
jgi:hypothetical protein